MLIDSINKKNNLEEEIERLNTLLKKEMAKNAYISVTGKSLTDIQVDGINEMVFKLSDGKSNITLDDIQHYIENKEKGF